MCLKINLKACEPGERRKHTSFHKVLTATLLAEKSRITLSTYISARNIKDRMVSISEFSTYM